MSRPKDDSTSFLADLGERLRTQDGMSSEHGPTHATAHPLYQVQQKERIYGVDERHHDPDGWVIFDDDEYADLDPLGSIPDEAVAFDERWEFVQGAVSLTRSGIEEYLKINGHNLNEPRIYVTSMYRVWEMIQLVEILSEAQAVTSPSNLAPDSDEQISAAVCQTLGIGMTHWRLRDTEDRWHKISNLPQPLSPSAAKRIEYLYPNVLTPEGCARVKAAASKACGWPVVIQDNESGEMEYVCWIQTEPANIDEDANLSDLSGVHLAFSTQDNEGARADTEERAVALAVLAWAKEAGR